MANSSQYVQLYEEGVDLIWPYLHLEGRDKKDLSTANQETLILGIKKLSESILKNPDDPRHWVTFWMIGKAYEALSKFQESLQFFLKALSVNDNELSILRELTGVCILLGLFSDSAKYAKLAVMISPNDSTLIANYALSEWKLGNIQDALALIKKAKFLNPSNTRITKLHCQILAENT